MILSGTIIPRDMASKFHDPSYGDKYKYLHHRALL